MFVRDRAETANADLPPMASSEPERVFLRLLQMSGSAAGLFLAHPVHRQDRLDRLRV